MTTPSSPCPRAARRRRVRSPHVGSGFRKSSSLQRSPDEAVRGSKLIGSRDLLARRRNFGQRERLMLVCRWKDCRSWSRSCAKPDMKEPEMARETGTLGCLGAIRSATTSD